MVARMTTRAELASTARVIRKLFVEVKKGKQRTPLTDSTPVSRIRTLARRLERDRAELIEGLETLLDRLTDGRREMSAGELEENSELIRALLARIEKEGKT